MPISRPRTAVSGVLVVLICLANTSAQIRKSISVDRPGVSLGEIVSGGTDSMITTSSESEFHGRVTDNAGRSIKAARIVLYCLETDQIHRASSNTFGYYQFKGLTDGRSFLVSISHPRYIFLTGSLTFTLSGKPIEIDFHAGKIR